MYGFRYAYDQRGNRTNKSVFSSPASEVYYEHDARNLVTKEHVLSGDTSYYAYDLAQRMTSLNVTGSGQSAYFTHDQRGQATQIDFAKASSPDATRTFAYNGRGERVFVDDGQLTYWQHDGQKLVLERLPTGAPVRRYRRNKSASGCASDVVEVALPSGIRVYQASDPYGSPRTMVDHLEGVPRGRYVEDAFGNTLIDENDLAGLAQVRARWQGAAISRLSTANTALYLPSGGLAYLPGSAALTALGAGLVSRVALATNGSDGDGWVWCMAPAAQGCRVGPPKVYAKEIRSVKDLDTRTDPVGGFSFCAAKFFGDTWPAEIPLPDVTREFSIRLSRRRERFGVLFFIEFPVDESAGYCHPRWFEYGVAARSSRRGQQIVWHDVVGTFSEGEGPPPDQPGGLRTRTTEVERDRVGRLRLVPNDPNRPEDNRTIVWATFDRALGDGYPQSWIFCDAPGAIEDPTDVRYAGHSLDLSMEVAISDLSSGRPLARAGLQGLRVDARPVESPANVPRVFPGRFGIRGGETFWVYASNFGEYASWTPH